MVRKRVTTVVLSCVLLASCGAISGCSSSEAAFGEAFIEDNYDIDASVRYIRNGGTDDTGEYVYITYDSDELRVPVTCKVYNGIKDVNTISDNYNEMKFISDLINDIGEQAKLDCSACTWQCNGVTVSPKYIRGEFKSASEAVKNMDKMNKEYREWMHEHHPNMPSSNLAGVGMISFDMFCTYNTFNHCYMYEALDKILDGGKADYNINIRVYTLDDNGYEKFCKIYNSNSGKNTDSWSIIKSVGGCTQHVYSNMGSKILSKERFNSGVII